MNLTRRTQFGRFYFHIAITRDVQYTELKVSLEHSLEVVMYFWSSLPFIAIRIYCTRSVVTMQSSITKADFEEGMKGAVGWDSKNPS